MLLLESNPRVHYPITEDFWNDGVRPSGLRLWEFTSILRDEAVGLVLFTMGIGKNRGSVLCKR